MAGELVITRFLERLPIAEELLELYVPLLFG
jgi:hypothetical protein